MQLSRYYLDIAQQFRIGNTDLVELPALGIRNRILAKAENQNYTGSHYDRVYLWLLNELESLGTIHPDHTTLVETTSGNAGISCAFIAEQRGYKCLIFTPAGARPRCNEIMRSYGAEVREILGDNYVADARDAMSAFLKEHIRERSDKYRSYFPPNHSQVKTSYEALAPIASEAIVQAGGRFNVFIGGAGNGSTLRGIGQELKRRNPQTKIYAFDPAEALQGYQLKYGLVPEYKPRRHRLFGVGGWNIDFPHLNYAIDHLVEDVLIVAEEDWVPAQAELHRLGHDVGHTSAAAYHLAREHCRHHANQNVLIIFYDDARHY